MPRNKNIQTPKPPFMPPSQTTPPRRVTDTYTEADVAHIPYVLRLPEPIPPSRPRYEYTTLSAERPLTAAQLDSYGVDGWRVAGVYVRMDAVHVIFEREAA